MIVLRVALTLFLGLCFLPAEPARAASPELTFVFDVGTLPEDESLIREGARFAVEFGARVLDTPLQEPVTVDAQFESPEYWQVGVAEGHRIVLNLSTSQWPQMTAARKLSILMHEIYHVLEFEMTEGWLHSSPNWLFEGAADYVGYLAVVDLGLISVEGAEAMFVGAILNGPVQPMPPLSTMETMEGFVAAGGSGFQLACLAIHKLVSESGPHALRQFFRALTDGRTWQQAFRRAFDVEPSVFYERFEQARTQIYEPGYWPVPFMQVGSPIDQAAWVAISSVSDFVVRGNQGHLIAATAPHTRCNLSLVSPRGREIARETAVADAGGTVFWLWTVRSDAARGAATINVSCGAEPASTTVEFV
jgi:hypothetical protein